MAQKHEFMAKLQAARQTSGKIVAAESQKAYPQESESRQSEFTPVPVPPVTNGYTAVPENPARTTLDVQSDEQPTESPIELTTGGEAKRDSEKITYTTISVPKQYGQKAKLYATLLKVNMVEFTCGALDAYIAQLQEAHKIPRVDL